MRNKISETKVIEKSDEYWHYFIHANVTAKELSSITGKYLFFSNDRKRLEEIARDEIQNNGFICAKVSLTRIGDDDVLCLYYKDDSRRNEFRDKYPEVHYRYWKSDADTLAGKYSAEFLEDMKRYRDKVKNTPE